jgi:protein-disulfide isomerase
MTRRRPALALVGALLLAAACGGGAGPAPAVSDEMISQRVIDYFQKTVTTPGLNFKVTKIEDSDVPGWRKGNLEVSLGPQTQNVAFYVDREGKYLFRGDAVDLTTDPLKQVMNKISLANQPERGPKDARVTVVEYSDFQCPFCARVYTTLENEVLKDYGDKVRFVFKNFPLTSIHPWAEDGAIASECAFQQGNDKFWAMYNGLFSKQSEITKENVKDKASEIAKEAGLDVDKFRDCLDGRKSLDAVKADESEATALGVNSTPTFFINGRRLSGAQSAQDFKQTIDQELAGAKG